MKGSLRGGVEQALAQLDRRERATIEHKHLAEEAKSCPWRSWTLDAALEQWARAILELHAHDHASAGKWQLEKVVEN